MPLYSYGCLNHSWDEARPVAGRDALATCPKCGAIGVRQLTAAVVHGFEEYTDENLAADGSGEPYHVKSREHLKQRRKDLGLVDPGPSQRAKDLRRERERGRLTFLPSSLK